MSNAVSRGRDRRDGAWTPGEMLAVAAAAQVRPGDVTLVGLGLPQVAALLAKRTHAPDAQILLELGVFEPHPTESAMGVADPRMWAGAQAFGGMVDVLGAMLQRGRVSLGMLGSLQVDPQGSVNTTLVNTSGGGTRRFNGSGGGNDIASLAGRVVIIVRHDSRKFRERVDFLTSPGRRVDGLSRSELGLPGRGTTAIVSDRAVIEITDEGAVLASVHSGESVEAVLADTPMPLTLPEGGPAETARPTGTQLELIRSELDPSRWYTGGSR